MTPSIIVLTLWVILPLAVLVGVDRILSLPRWEVFDHRDPYTPREGEGW